MFFNFFFSKTKIGRKAKGRALFGLAVHPDLSTHHIDQTFGDSQSKSRSTEFAGRRGVRLAKRLKQLADLVFSQPDAGVSNGKHDL